MPSYRVQVHLCLYDTSDGAARRWSWLLLGEHFEAQRVSARTSVPAFKSFGVLGDGAKCKSLIPTLAGNMAQCYCRHMGPKK